MHASDVYSKPSEVNVKRRKKDRRFSVTSIHAIRRVYQRLTSNSMNHPSQLQASLHYSTRSPQPTLN